jgi:D-tyrosyl-tRNA(Tyr) deacylase
MRALIQRVSQASIQVAGQKICEMSKHGLLVFLGVTHTDRESDLEWIIQKCHKLRVFEDSEGKLNRSIAEVQGEWTWVSQFTLYADAERGNRPGFKEAARPEVAEPLYRRALELAAATGVPTHGGQFQAHMNVTLSNNGPLTLWIESPKKS